MDVMKSLLPENWRNWSFLLLSLLVLSLVPAIIGAVMAENWQSAFLAAVTVVFILLPLPLQAKTGVYVPRIFSIALALFVYATLFLGEANRFYYDVWWWDVMLHSGSAFAFGLLGLIVLMLSVSKQTIRAKPIVLSLFAFSFSLMIGVLWEVFEFTGDQLFNMDMQKDGLNDTMWDFIVNTIGALVAAVIGYFYLTPHTPNTPLDPVLEKVVEENK
ncbi:MAG TPA: hypothetical protein VEA92_03230 [Candidatus Paceibacterota bacterium]|nr:hypothetical protein [Candidatus Paceibacterota bacterium]